MNIVLLDFSLEGHHFSFVRSFSKILLQQGHTIFCIAPKVQKVTHWIMEQAAENRDHFKGSDYNYNPIAPKGWGRFNSTLKTLHRWHYEGKLIKKVEKENNKKIDLVFYAWIDDQLSQYIHPYLLNRIFPFKWAGLYFHPYHLRLEAPFLKRKANWRDMDAAFLSGNCIAVAVHDLGIISDFRKRIGKPVIHFPETADGTPPDLELPLYKEIKKKAAGRLVVGMIGCEAHKGTLTMMRMSKEVSARDFFFAFIGTLPQSTYTNNDWNEVQEFINEKKENFFFNFHPVPEGAAYNAVFCSFDIPFLVYDNFISSSNRLTKAAIFEKLVLASDNYCVGEDVKSYRLGVAVQPKNSNEAKQGLLRLAAQIRNKDFPCEPWKQYRELNSDDKLFERFRELTTLLSP